jgi:hypothetical protein
VAAAAATATEDPVVMPEETAEEEALPEPAVKDGLA